MLAATTGALAQELSDLRWLEGDSPVFAISAPPETPFTTEVLDNGYRLRISFPDATLARNIRDIGESGIVRGVFPYETDDPDRANFDVLLKTEGGLKIAPVEGGFEVTVLERGESAEVMASAGAGAAAGDAETVTSADPGPYAGLTELERTVLAEIEGGGAAAEDGAGRAAASTEPEVAEAATGVEESGGQRARVVLPPSEPEETGAAPPATSDVEQGATIAAAEPAPPAADVAAAAPRSTPPAAAVSPAVRQDDAVAAADTSRQDTATFDAQRPAPAANDTSPMPVADADEVLRAEIERAERAAATAGGDRDARPAPMPEIADEPTFDGASRLESITYSELPGGRLQVNFNLRAGGDPGIFRTNQPPRIVLDFFDTESAVAESVQRVGFGALESIVTAQTDDRTRVILNLVAPVEYEQRREDGGVVLVMSSPSDTRVAPSLSASQRPMFETPATRSLPFAVDDVDFRRTPEGGGKVTVTMTSPEIGVDVHEEAGEIVIDFPGTNLPPDLEKRLDVTDFATPVQTVDMFFTGSGARMIISPVGQYSYSSYQVGDVLTVQVSPRAEDDDEREPDEFGYVGERLSFNFQRISVRAALQVIADFTGLNFVTSDSVTGDLSLRLQDVPWDQALDTILQVKGLAKRQKGNVVWVAPAEEIATKERQALEAQSQVSELEPLVSELIQINYAKADDIAQILKSVRAIDTGYERSLFGSVTISEIETESNSLLSARGNVTVDPRTNTILVQDTRAKITEIRKLIARLDRPVRQVLIETRIVEANDDFSRNIGARLGFTRVTENARFPGVSDSNLGTVIGSASIEDNDLVRDGGSVGDRAGVSVDLAADGLGNQNAASYAFTLAKAGAGFSHLIDLEISALEAEGTGKVIANPRLLTTDQNEAHIEQGQERVFTTSVLGEGSVVTKKAVLGLTVTPQITPDDRLVLDVFVTKDSFTAADDSTINTKQIRTKVLLDNGETVVIGGIYEQSRAESTSKVPLLGDIPVVGALFRKRSSFDNRTELLIFLTPRILDPALTAN